jgi:excisionase family DNA binding protein
MQPPIHSSDNKTTMLPPKDVRAAPNKLTKEEVELARRSIVVITEYMETTKAPVFEIVDKSRSRKRVELPISALKLLVTILKGMSKGQVVTLQPHQQILTTQQAAELLNVSRPYFVKLLKEDKIPSRRVGVRRRVLLQDVLDYKARIDQARLKTLAKLSEEAQKLNLGY